ncbi:MAG: TlpA disulfide reductase family protein [FCB group bacterium]|jgi:peroxiredoxin
MKLIISILLFFYSSELAIPQLQDTVSANKIINDFINVVTSYKIIQYSSYETNTGILIDNSEIMFTNTYELISNNNVTYVNYNISNFFHQFIYNGEEFLEYYWRLYGDSIVDVINIKNNPDRFVNKEMNWGGEKYIITSEKKSYLPHSLFVLLNLAYELQSKGKLSRLPDSTINGIECYRISYTIEDSLIDNEKKYIIQTFGFGKNSKLLVYYKHYSDILNRHSDDGTIFFWDYTLNLENSDKYFSRKAFPSDFKFIDNAPIKQHEISLTIGTEAPDWTLKTIKGEEINLKKLRGKPVFLIFTDIGCAACQLALPKIKEFTKEHENIKVLSIYGRNAKEDLLRYSKQKEIPYDILYNAKYLEKQYKIVGFPTFVLIDKDGKIKYSREGFYQDSSKIEWNEALEKLPKGVYLKW